MESRCFLKQIEEFTSARSAKQPSQSDADADSRVGFDLLLVNQKELSCLLGLTSLNIWQLVVKQPSEGKGFTSNWQLTSFLLMW